MNVLHTRILNRESTKTPLVILHGLFGMSDNWNSLGKKFAKERPVFIVDLRNHGDSFWDDDMSLKSMSDDLLQLLNHYSLDKIDLMGHSLGGKVVLQFLVDQSSRVKKAVIVDIALKSYPPHHQGIIKALQSVDEKIDNSRKKIEEQLAEYIPNIDVRQFLLKNYKRNANNQYQLRINLNSIAENYICLLSEIKIKQDIVTPTLFIRGEKSDYIDDSDVIKIEDNFPNGKIVTINQAGHWVHAEQPEVFYNVVNNFLK